MDNLPADTLLEIETNQLQSNPLQPRGVITQESLVDLVESIREQGIIEPLVIAETPAGYQIIAGERRWRAAKVLGLPKVPAIIKTSDCLGLALKIVPNLSKSYLEAPVAIISIAQQARPNCMGQMEPRRPQL